MPSDDSLRSRIDTSTATLWILLDGNRLVLAGSLLVGVFAVLVAVVAIDPTPLGAAVARADPVSTLFQALLTAIVTGVTLVVTINQVVLSQELGAAGDQQDRMQGSLSYHEDVAALTGDPASPLQPAELLRVLLATTADRAGDLADAAGRAGDPELRHRIERYTENLVENLDPVERELDAAEFGTFDAIRSALDFEYSVELGEGRRIESLYDAELDEDGSAALDDVLRGLELYGTSREHVKTLYFQWELVALSRVILYVSVPALVVSVAALLTLDAPGAVPGSTLGVAHVSWVIVAAATVGLAPFAVLLSYILRIATVARRTLAIGPLALREIDSDEYAGLGRE